MTDDAMRQGAVAASIPIDASFRIVRTIDAPRERVFKAWTDPAALAQWWGPKGLQTEVLRHELKTSGVFHYVMRAPGGFEMFGRIIYGEIVPPELLTFVLSFADAGANPVRSPFSAGWPLETFNSLTLTEENGQTHMELVGTPVSATPEEQAEYKQGHASMEQGFGSAFDALASYLARS